MCGDSDGVCIRSVQSECNPSQPGGNSSDWFVTVTFNTVDICLHEGFVANGTWETIGTIGSTMVDERMMTFQAAVIIPKELIFRGQKTRALFMGGIVCRSQRAQGGKGG